MNKGKTLRKESCLPLWTRNKKESYTCERYSPWSYATLSTPYNDIKGELCFLMSLF